MKTKARIVINSYLTDTQDSLNFVNESTIKRTIENINFVKFIVNKVEGDLTKDIDIVELWKEFNLKNT